MLYWLAPATRFSVSLLLFLRLPTTFAFDCTDLRIFASDRDQLDTFLAGGDIVDTSPVFIDVPRLDIQSFRTTVLCLQDIPIPTSINGVNCLGNTDPSGPPTKFWNNCYLSVGRKPLPDNSMGFCEDNIPQCYDCTCSGTHFGSGQPNRTVVNSCGNAINDYAVSCPDVQNGRGFNATGGPSEFAAVHISACPVFSSRGNVCRGGSQAPFRVALQWVIDFETQCSDRPFNSGSQAIQSAVVVGMFLIALVL